MDPSTAEDVIAGTATEGVGVATRTSGELVEAAVDDAAGVLEPTGDEETTALDEAAEVDEATGGEEATGVDEASGVDEAAIKESTVDGAFVLCTGIEE